MNRAATILIYFAFCCTNYPVETDNPDTKPPDYVANWEDARRVTIDAWEELIGKVSSKCYTYTKQVIIEQVDFIASDGNKQTVGRTYFTVKEDGTEQVIMKLLRDRTEVEKMDSCIHEFIHILGNCEVGNPDKGELHTVWWEGYGGESVEALACASY